MAREIEEINASSMADIAFLLLIFFIVTQTLLREKVLEERLPQRVPENQIPPKVMPKDVLEIVANRKDQILLERELAEIEDIKEKVREFYVHPKSSANWPTLTRITQAGVKDSIAKLKAYIAQGEDQYDDELEKMEGKLKTIELVGEYDELAKEGMVTIQLDNSTKFETYLKVLDQIMLGLNELRDELSREKFNIPYDKLNEANEEDREKLKALRTVYPKKIMKAKNVNTQ
ncbi:MAG: biopolymer transporter ExbD [Flavobacteriales bacterium]|jgi:biopolymer transport protein ExbD|nr:biopolymer transporter ExbD [Flavobacteriales bacterium]